MLASGYAAEIQFGRVYLQEVLRRPYSLYQ